MSVIKTECERDGIKNIEIIQGEEEDPLFPKNSLDLVIMVYVIHHLDNPAPFLQKIIPSLKSKATLVIVERDPHRYGGEFGHFFSKEKVLEVIKLTDFKLERVETFLPRDNIYIFGVK